MLENQRFIKSVFCRLFPFPAMVAAWPHGLPARARSSVAAAALSRRGGDCYHLPAAGGVAACFAVPVRV